MANSYLHRYCLAIIYCKILGLLEGLFGVGRVCSQEQLILYGRWAGGGGGAYYWRELFVKIR